MGLLRAGLRLACLRRLSSRPPRDDDVTELDVLPSERLTDFSFLRPQSYGVQRPRVRIEAYSDDSFVIGGVNVGGSIFVLRSYVFSWKPTSYARLNVSHFAPLTLLQDPPDLLILGTGAVMRPAPKLVLDFLRPFGVAVEVMDTVCRIRPSLTISAKCDGNFQLFEPRFIPPPHYYIFFLSAASNLCRGTQHCRGAASVQSNGLTSLM